MDKKTRITAFLSFPAESTAEALKILEAAQSLRKVVIDDNGNIKVIEATYVDISVKYS